MYIYYQITVSAVPARLYCPEQGAALLWNRVTHAVGATTGALFFNAVASQCVVISFTLKLHPDLGSTYISTCIELLLCSFVGTHWS